MAAATGAATLVVAPLSVPDAGAAVGCSAPIPNPVSTVDCLVAAVAGGGSVDVADGTYALSTELVVSKNNTAIRAVHPGKVVLQFAGSAGRVVNVRATGVVIDGVTVTGGAAGASDGGGILVNRNSSITLTRSSVLSNSASSGAGINNLGTLTLDESTVAGNVAVKKGGGILTQGTATVTNSTFTGNVAAQGGAVSSPGATTLVHTTIVGNTSTSSASAGVDRNGGTFQISYSILGANVRTNGSAASDCSGTPDLLGLNLVSNTSGCNPVGAVLIGSPGVGPLADNGGPTRTMALLSSSPALDARTPAGACNASTAPVDQRGVPRPAGPCRDLGAFEVAPLGLDLALTTDSSSHDPALPPGTVEVGLVSAPVGAITSELASTPPSNPDAAARSAALHSIALHSITIEDMSNAAPGTEAAALHSIALHSIALHSIALHSIALHSIALHSITLPALTLAQIPLTANGGWGAILVGTPFAGLPLNSVTLEQVEADPTARPRLDGLSLADLDVAASALHSIALHSILLAGVALHSIPVGGSEPGTAANDNAWCTVLASLCPSEISASALGSLDLLGAQLAGADISGVDLTSIPLGPAAAGVQASALHSIALHSIFLQSSALHSIALHSIALHSITALPALIDCTAFARFCVTDASNTATLGDAVAAGALNPAATVETLLALACAPGDSSCIDVFTGLSLADLLLAFVAPDVAPWEQINLESALIQNVGDPAQPTFDYVATVTVSNVPAAVTVTLTLPGGFAVATRSGEQATLDGVAISRDATTGLGAARFVLNGLRPGAHVLRVPARAGIQTGTGFTALGAAEGSAPGSPNVTDTDTTSVNVVSASVGDGLNSSSTLRFGSLELAHIDEGDSVDLYSFTLPAEYPDGITARVLLSNIPAGVDYDLAIYSPADQPLRGTPQGTLDSLGDTRYDLHPGDDSVSTDVVDDLALDAPARFGYSGYALRDVSNLRCAKHQPTAAACQNPDEEVVLRGVRTGVTYLVAVASYLGDFSNRPYALRLRVDEASQMPACVAGDRTFGAAPSTRPVTLPGGVTNAQVNTLYITNWQRLASEAPEAGSIRDAALATNGVAGVVPAFVTVDADAATKAAYDAWNLSANRCDPERRNDVVRAIGLVLDRAGGLRATYPNVTTIVIVGGDGVVPMAAVHDMTGYSNETTFAREVLTGGASNEVAGALGAGYLLTDDPYSTSAGLAIRGAGHELYAPDVNLGRLVETGQEILRQLTNFIASGGQLDPATTARNALVTGYDFLADGATDIAATLGSVAATTTLISPPDPNWTRDSYLGLFATKADAISPNAHYDDDSLLPAAANAAGTYGQSDLVTTSDFTGDTAGRLPGQAVVFTMGCHAGLSVDDVELGFSRLDWSQLYASGGNQFLGHTTYGYGDTEIVAYSEKLTGLFAANLAAIVAGSPGAPASLGDAIRLAKRAYLAGTLVLTPYDEKVMQSLTYYGLPMYRVAGSAPAGPAALGAGLTTAPTSPVSFGLTSTDPRTGLDVQPVHVALTPTVADSAPMNVNRVTTPDGTFYEVGGNTVSAPHHPVEPLVDAAIPSGQASGFLITGMTSFEESPFTPVYQQPVVDLGAGEPAVIPNDGSFPSRLQRVTTDGLGHQHLLIAAGQFQGDPSTPGVGRQRIYTAIDGQLYQAGPGSDGVGPSFVAVSGQIGVNDNHVVFFSVETGETARRVVVVYRITGFNTWRSIDLANAHGNVWIGGIPVDTGEIVEFFAEAVGADGDVSISDNKVDNFFSSAATVDGDLTIAVTSGIETGGYYNTPVVVTITGITGSAQYSVDGGPFAAYTGPFTVSGDGGHVIFAQDSSGAQLLYVVIDGFVPVVTATRAPDVAWTTGPGTVLLDATDVGQSGVRSITYSLSGATTAGPTTVAADQVGIPISAPGATTVTAYATDNAGNQSSPVSTTLGIDANAPTIAASPTDVPWTSTATVTLTGADTAPAGVNAASGIASITYTLTGATASGPTTVDGATTSVAVSNEGITTLTAFSTDAAGNQSTPTTVVVRLDRTGPALTATPVGLQPWSNASNRTVTLQASDAGSGVASISYCTASCATPASWTTVAGATTSVTVSAEGATTLLAQATDVAGNASAQTSTTIRLDRTNPAMGTPTVTPASVNGWVRSAATVGFSSTDTGSGVASITYSATGAGSVGTTMVAGASASVVVSAQGVTVVGAYATDNAANSSSAASITVQLDSVAPTAGLTLVQSDVDGDGLLDTTGATYSCTDPTPGSGTSRCELLLDGTVVASTTTGASTTYTFGSLTQGVHTLLVRATDVAGNQSTTSATTFTAGYRVCLLYDPTQAKTIGATYTIKIQLCDAAGHNVSSKNITLTALTVDGRLDPGTNDAGNSNTGYVFRWVASDSSYIYNLKTNSLTAGTHLLSFTTQPVPDRSGLPATPPPTNAAPFSLKV